MEAELQLIEKVELRITLSSSDEKFQQSLNTFLAPLLLKLASPHNQVRSKILKFVGHLMTRIGSSPEVKLPIQKLLQQAKSPLAPDGTNQNVSNVKLYSYLFVSKGLERENDLTAIVNYIPLILNCIEEQSKHTTTEGPAVLARAFNIFCKLVAKFNERSLKQFSIEFSQIYKSPDEFTTSFLNINDNKKGLDIIFSKIENIFLLLPNNSTSGQINEFYHCPGLSNYEVKFLTYDAGVSFNYNNLNELKIKFLLFLSLLDISNDAISKNSHFLLIFFFATVDTNSSIRDIASNTLRKVDFSDATFNNPVLIEAALQYYLGDNQRKSVPPQIQETLLTKIFMKSTKVFDYGGEKLAQISKIGFDSSLPKLKKSALLFAKYSSARNSKSIGYSQDVKNFNTEMASIILQNIQNEGWPKLQLSNIPTMKVTLVLENRRLQYEALSDFIRNEPKLLLDDELTYLKFFFNSVRGELHDNVSVVQDALAKLISNFSRFFYIEPDSDKKKKVAASLKIFFKNFLGRDFSDTDADGDVEMQNTIETRPEISSAVSSCRYLAIKFTNALFEYNDVEARFLNIYGSLYSNRYDVVEASGKGLNPYWFNLYKSSLDIPEKTFNKLNGTDSGSQNSLKGTTSVLKTTKELLGFNNINKLVFPSFTELVKQLQQEIEYYHKYPYSSLLPAVLADTFKYLLKILVMESVKGQSTVIVVDEDWDFRVEKALELDEKVRGLVTTFLKKTDASAGESKDFLTLYLNSIVNEYLSFNSISHQNKTLKNDLQSFNLVYKNIYQFGPIFNSIVSLTDTNTINRIVNKPLIENLLSLINIEVTDSSIKYNKTFYARLVQYETISILSKSIGIILSNGLLDTEILKNIVNRLLTPISHFTKSLQLYSANSITSEDADFVIARLDIIGHLVGRLNVTKRLSDIVNIGSFFEELLSNYKSLFKSSYESKNWRHFQILLDGLNELSKYGALNANNISTGALECLSDVKELVKTRMKKSDEKSCLTWAYLSLVLPPSQPVKDNKTENCDYLQALYDTHTFKQSEFLFAGGEALTILASGWDSKVLTKTLDVQGYNIDAIKQLVLPKSTQSLGIIVAMVLKSCANTKPSLRKAACIWLLSLVKYCGHLEPVYSKSKEIHVAFMRYLAENDDLIQESASTGLSLIYEMGNSDLKETLVKGLIKSFTSSTGATNLTAGTISEETELFEPGILNTPDGSISTYKDILSLASEVGDPSLVYKFMSLTKSSALWASRKGIAFGLGNIMSKSNLEQLLQSNDTLTKNLIVKLYRYKFDPNENVSRSMSDIWNILVPNSSKIIELNSNIILQELLTSISNREWRVRQAATVALVDLLQVLKIEMYEDKLEEIWTLAFRSMDDIKDSVRDSGTKLTKFLANNLIRSLENANSGATAKNYDKILTNLIPFLVGTKGILSGVEEVRSYSLSIILKLCMKAGDALKPFIPGLIEELLSLMSTLEPQIVNYLALNADKYNLKSSDIDAKRLTSVGHSPMMEAVERMLDLADDDLMKELVPKLNSAIKKSVGLPSKVAVSKVLVTLVVKHLFLLNESYGAILLKTCISQLKDRNETVAIAYANAAGYLCRVCEIDAIVKYGVFLKDLYFDCKSEQERKIAGVGCESIAKFSTDKFSKVASFFLPLAFVCQNDENSSVADKFKSVWIENTGGKSAAKLYIDEICNIVTEQLQSQQYSIRQVCAKAIANACTLMSSNNVNSADQNIVGLNNDMVERLFAILLEACKGRSWNGKEVVLNALVTFTKNFKNKAIDDDYKLYHQIEKVVLVEAKKRNKQYQKESIKSLGLFAEVFPSSKLYGEEIRIIKPFLQDSFYEQSDSSDDDSDNDDDDDKSAAKKIKTEKQYSKSSAVNCERETTNIDLLATLANSFTIEPITDSNNNIKSKAVPLEMIKYIFAEAIPYFFQSAHVIPTWRSKLAVSQNSATVLERIAKYYNNNDDTNTQVVPVEWLSSLYKTLKTHCLEDPDIENVRVQAAGAISVLLSVLSKYDNADNEVENAHHLKEKILQDLKNAYDKDLSTIVKVRIEKVLKEGK